MPHRTSLTAPPGIEPSEATRREDAEARERYGPGLASATEPHIPSRWRTPVVVLALLAILVAAVVGVMRASAASQAQNPSLFVPGTEQPEPPSLRDGIPQPQDDGVGPDGGLPGEG